MNNLTKKMLRKKNCQRTLSIVNGGRVISSQVKAFNERKCVAKQKQK